MFAGLCLTQANLPLQGSSRSIPLAEVLCPQCQGNLGDAPHSARVRGLAGFRNGTDEDLRERSVGHVWYLQPGLSQALGDTRHIFVTPVPFDEFFLHVLSKVRIKI